MAKGKGKDSKDKSKDDSKSKSKSNSDASEDLSAALGDLLDPSSSSETSLSTASPLHLVQNALDMLDYRTTIELSTRALLSRHSASTTSQLYNLRSIAHEKLGRFSLAVEDAEKAVEADETTPTHHLRLALAHEAASLHSISRAREKLSNLQEQNREGFNSSLSVENLQSAEQRLIQNQSLVRKSPFRRISPEQFTRTISFCDAPTIAKSMAVSQDWRRSIISKKGLFRNFEMKGRVQDICKGLELFNQQSNNGITSLSLVILSSEDSLQTETYIRTERDDQNQLWKAIYPSLSRLETISISTSTHLAIIIPAILRKKLQLKVLKALTHRKDQDLPLRSLAIDLSKMISYEMELEELVWHRSIYDINYALFLPSISYFKKLKRLEINSTQATEEVLIKFLTNCPKLETVIFPRDFADRVSVLSIPETQVPSLRYLELMSIPSESDFFPKLHFPNLKVLKITSLYCYELRLLTSISTLEELSIKSIETDVFRPGDMDKLGEIESVGLLKILSKATSLKTLRLQLRADKTTYRFWESSISSMTPLSSVNARKGTEDQPFIMPKLEVVELGNGTSESTPSTQANELKLDSEITAGVVSLIAARKFASQGFSKSSVCLAANGFVEDVEEQVENAESSHCQYSAIKDLSFQVKIKSNQKSVEWLKDNVQKSDLSGFWWESEE